MPKHAQSAASGCLRDATRLQRSFDAAAPSNTKNLNHVLAPTERFKVPGSL